MDMLMTILVVANLTALAIILWNEVFHIVAYCFMDWNDDDCDEDCENF